jgi:hypothetical protein
VREHLGTEDPLQAFGLVPAGSAGTLNGSELLRALMRAADPSYGDEGPLPNPDPAYRRRIVEMLLVRLAGVKESGRPVSAAMAGFAVASAYGKSAWTLARRQSHHPALELAMVLRRLRDTVLEWPGRSRDLCHRYL